MSRPRSRRWAACISGASPSSPAGRWRMGQIGGVPFMGLPGNPVAVMVTFLMLARPLILRLAGAVAVPPPRLFRVTAGFDYKKRANRCEYRARPAGARRRWRLDRREKFPRDGAGILIVDGRVRRAGGIRRGREPRRGRRAGRFPALQRGDRMSDGLDLTQPLAAFRLDGEMALVTGGASGIGRAVALAFARVGARVAVLDRDAVAGAETAAEITAFGGKAEAHALDVTEARAVDRLFADIFERHGRLDVLVNSAGIAIRKPTLELTLAEWERVMAVNATGSFLCARAAARHMLEGDGGRIVNIASIMGFSGGIYPNVSYQTSKGAVVNLTRALAVEWARARHPRQRGGADLHPHAAHPAAVREAGSLGGDRAAHADGPHRRARGYRRRRALPGEPRLGAGHRPHPRRRRRLPRAMSAVDLRRASSPVVPAKAGTTDKDFALERIWAKP